MRASGILLPIFSLPSRYGIGCFSQEARDFARGLREAGQRYWQILPLGPTSYGDSPYQSFSAFAGNPYFIDLDTLAREGLLFPEEYEGVDFGGEEGFIDYGKLYERRFPVLKQAFSRWNPEGNRDYEDFCRENALWLEDYCLYMAVKARFGQRSWLEWDEDIRMRRPKALERYRDLCREEMAFHAFLQYQFYRQWSALKAYVNELGIRMIGDIPIYVALDSADSWASPELFRFDGDRRPLKVAGCPPDAFSADGQLWGNPLYDWEYHERTGYAWWIRRMEHCFRIYDVVRVDHFRGFDEYYTIPYGNQTAAGGCWEKGPGMKLFSALKEHLKEVPIIVEDLGYLTDSVARLVRDTGYPGMKVLEFAFDSREAGDYIPYRYPSHCVVYTGTHDNTPLAAWYEELACEDRALARDYLDLGEKSGKEAAWAFIRLALACRADTAVIPMTDYLCKGAEARINHPSTIGSNWRWRMGREEFPESLRARIRRLTSVYGRLQPGG